MPVSLEQTSLSAQNAHIFAPAVCTVPGPPMCDLPRQRPLSQPASFEGLVAEFQVKAMAVRCKLV
jgi:hypothetical protein